jgi:hypothetical protein
MLDYAMQEVYQINKILVILYVPIRTALITAISTPDLIKEG